MAPDEKPRLMSLAEWHCRQTLERLRNYLDLMGDPGRRKHVEDLIVEEEDRLRRIVLGPDAPAPSGGDAGA